MLSFFSDIVSLSPEHRTVQDVVQYGCLGLIAFLVVYTSSRIVPKAIDSYKAISDQFVAELKCQRAEHSKERREDRQEFLSAIGNQADRTTAEIAKLSEAWDATSSRSKS